ncbi:MAG: THAP domain-containing protein [Gammaproteobacteria bacterium]|nr:THAP domain-containing protein [Gammaproteobacteria bacterium]
MPFKCCAPGCRTGYRPRTSDNEFLIEEEFNETPSTHKLPRDNPALMKIWLERLGYDPSWQPSKSARICALHFKKSNLSSAREDTNKSRRETLSEVYHLELCPNHAKTA